MDATGCAAYTCDMAFGIILYDETRTIRAIDDAAAVVFTKPARELIGRNLYDFIPRPDRDQMAAARATFERFGEASGTPSSSRTGRGSRSRSRCWRTRRFPA